MPVPLERSISTLSDWATAGVAVQPAWRPFKDSARVWLNSACRPFGAVDEDMPDTWLARQAADYLTQPRDRPFFLMVSFYEPHSPFRFPVEYRWSYGQTSCVPPTASRFDAFPSAGLHCPA